MTLAGNHEWSRLSALVGSESMEPVGSVFLDIETTGLADTPLFLIGLMECNRDGFHFRQYFARHCCEESGVIIAASQRLEQASILFTFNGASFDIPHIRRRAAVSQVEFSEPRVHIDLLLEARLRYARDLPNCRLQTLEQMICGRFREDDLPSAQIPGAYYEFLETGNPSHIVRILRHNLYDLLTMADLANRMWGRE
jgi:uncharacterized protein YprB with RNaseH-like and TPR domain